MLTGDDLSTQYFLAGTAIAILGIAVTQAGWNHRLFLQALFGMGGAILLSALFWKPIIELFPRITGVINPVASSSTAWFTLLVCVVCVVFWLDYQSRSGQRSLGSLSNEAINSSLQGLLGRVGSIELRPEPATIEDHEKLRTTVLGLTQENSQKLEHLEKNLIRNNQKIAGYDRDLPVTMETLMEALALSILFNTIQQPPSFSDDINDLDRATMRAESDRATNYRNEVRHILSSTQWRDRVNAILADANIMGEQELREIPEDRRPNIDALDLRHYMIARNACRQLSALVNLERREAATTYISHLERLRQAIWDRRQINRNAP